MWLCNVAKEFKKFWPQKDDPAEDYGHFHVAFQSNAEEGSYTSTDFLLQSTQVLAVNVHLSLYLPQFILNISERSFEIHNLGATCSFVYVFW